MEGEMSEGNNSNRLNW